MEFFPTLALKVFPSNTPSEFFFYLMSHLYFYTTLQILPELYPILLPASSCVSSLSRLHHHQINLSAYFFHNFCQQSKPSCPQDTSVRFPRSRLNSSITPISDSSRATANHCVQPSSSKRTSSFPHQIFLRRT